MKRLFILLAALCCTAAQAEAQSWLDALKKVATEAVDKATDGKLTEIAILGTWNYSAPAVRLSSDNTLAELGGAALSSTVGDKMRSLVEKVGIKEGFCSITFNNDNTFTMPVKGKSISGTYTYDAATHAVTLSIAKLGDVKGYAYVSGSALQLVFSTEKFSSFIINLGSSISALQSVTNLVKQYQDICLGFEFTK
ncbi:MAG: DUF4923 family protein [Alistipes sp.]|nr:DUF4923 family protein [Alistipes sp.]